MKQSYALPVAILVAGAILAGAVYLSVKPDSAATRAASLTPVSASDHIFGNPAATLLIVEYSDFECSHCKDFDATVRQIVTDHASEGNVALVLRNFPLTEIHPNAKKDAEAAECVAQTTGNDAYFAFVAKLFANQPVDPNNYLAYARASGADPTQVGSCLAAAASNGVDARIAADQTNALAIGASGTPFSVLVENGKEPIVIDGAWGYGDLNDQITTALAR